MVKVRTIFIFLFLSLVVFLKPNIVNASSYLLSSSAGSTPSATPYGAPVFVPDPVSLPGVPEMVYPVDGQILDLEGAYMFKVKPVDEASGYLFGLFQDGVMVYENYRDTRILSLNGEFALREDDPAHALFHSGEVKVMIRALIKGQWSDAKEITIILRPRSAARVLSPPKTTSTLDLPKEKISSAATDASALQKQIDDLQKKLEQSQQRQSAFEQKLAGIIGWIKSFFPLFK